MKPSVLFFGSDRFSSIALKYLHQEYIAGKLLSNLQVIAPPDLSQDKEPIYIAPFAKSLGIPVHRAPPKSLSQWSPPTGFDLAIVVSFGYFIPKHVLQSFKYSMNIHPSLLPKYRGSSPIQATLLNNDKECGVSLIELSPNKFDAGKIIKQSIFNIEKPYFYIELHDFLAEKASIDLIEIITNLDDAMIRAYKQDESNVSYARKIETSMSLIDWNLMDSETIYTRHRALSFKTPLYSTFRGKHIKFIDILDPIKTLFPLIDSSLNPSFGLIYYENHKDCQVIWVRCNESWIGITKLQVQGKKPVTPKDFINGYGLKSLTERFI